MDASSGAKPVDSPSGPFGTLIKSITGEESSNPLDWAPSTIFAVGAAIAAFMLLGAAAGAFYFSASTVIIASFAGVAAALALIAISVFIYNRCTQESDGFAKIDEIPYRDQPPAIAEPSHDVKSDRIYQALQQKAAAKGDPLNNFESVKKELAKQPLHDIEKIQVSDQFLKDCARGHFIIKFTDANGKRAEIEFKIGEHGSDAEAIAAKIIKALKDPALGEKKFSNKEIQNIVTVANQAALFDATQCLLLEAFALVQNPPQALPNNLVYEIDVDNRILTLSNSFAVSTDPFCGQGSFTPTVAYSISENNMEFNEVSLAHDPNPFFITDAGFNTPNAAINTEDLVGQLSRELKIDHLEIHQYLFHKDGVDTPADQEYFNNHCKDGETVFSLIFSGDYKYKGSTYRFERCEMNVTPVKKKEDIPATQTTFGITTQRASLIQ